MRTKNVDKKIAKLMGFSQLHPGTLNIELYEPYPINENYSEYIEASDYNNREWIKLVRCLFKGEKCVIVHPKDHDVVGTFKKRIELMSSYNLRKKFNLLDGDIVEVEVEGDETWWKGHIK